MKKNLTIFKKVFLGIFTLTLLFSSVKAQVGLPVFNWNLEAGNVLLDEGTVQQDLTDHGSVTTGGTEPDPPGYGSVGAVFNGTDQYLSITNSEFGDRALNGTDTTGTIYLAFSANAITSGSQYIWSMYDYTTDNRQLAICLNNSGQVIVIWGYGEGTDNDWMATYTSKIFEVGDSVIVGLTLNSNSKEYRLLSMKQEDTSYYQTTHNEIALTGVHHKGTADMVIGGRHGGTSIFNGNIYWVRIYDEVHTEEQMKAIMEGVLAPDAPGDLVAKESSDSRIKISWTDNSDDEVSFGLLRSDDGVTFTQIATLDPDVTSYQDEGLSASTEYTYKVFATNIIGNSDTVEASATTQITVVPSKDTPLYDWNFEAANIVLDEGPLQKDLTNVGSVVTGGTEPSPPGYGSVGAELDGTTQCFSLPIDEYGDHALHGIDTDGTVYVAAKLDAVTTISYLWSIYSLDNGRELGIVYYSGDIYLYSGRTGGTVYQKIKLDSYTLEIGHDIIVGMSINLATRDFIFTLKDVTTGEYYSMDQSTKGRLWEGHFSDSKADMVIGGRHGAASLADGTIYFTKIYDVAHDPNQIKAVMEGISVPEGSPSGLRAKTGSDSHINLDWADYATDELGVVIERSLDGVTFEPYDTLDANTVSYQDLGLDESTEYSYMIYAYDADGNTDTTNIATATTEATMPIPDNDPIFSWNMEAENVVLDEGTVGTNLTNVGNATTGGVEPNPPGYGSVGAVLDGSTQYFQISDSEYGNRALNGLDIDGTIYIAFQASAIPAATAYMWSKYSTSDNQRQLALTVTSAGTLQFLWGFKDGVSYQKLVLPPVISANQDIILAISINASKKVYTYTAYDVASGQYYTMTEEDQELWGRLNKGTADMVIGGRSGGAGLFNGTIYWTRIYDEAHTMGQMHTIIENLSIPLAPDGLSATDISDKQIDLAWTDNSSDEDGFGIQRSEDGIVYTVIDSVEADITTFQDTGLVAETKYYYQVFAYNLAGASEPCDSAFATTFKTGISPNHIGESVRNYPNPFSNYTTVSFTLSEPSEVSVNIYNATGQLVKTLIDRNMDKGKYTVQWDGCSDNGNKLPEGIYFCSLRTNNSITVSKKMILIR